MMQHPPSATRPSTLAPYATLFRSGLRVAIQGVCSVGGDLARALAAEGAMLTIADVDSARVEALAAELGCKAVPADEIMRISADVFSPCALGAFLTESNITALEVAVVWGAAKNQLATDEAGEELYCDGILSVTEYVIN